ncbi:MAG: hypothetical protein ACOX64_07240 [Candidatus Merdivicinus sp.]|jgi:hypothetical protein
MGKSKRAGRSGGLTVITIFVAVMLLFAGLCWWLWRNRDRGVPTRVLGYELMVVHGADMEPEFADGSLLLLSETVPQSLRSGDAVVYGRADGQGGTLSRIVNIVEKDGVSTALVKMDRTADPQELLLQEIGFRAAGAIPFLGSFWDFLMAGKGLLCVIVAPCLLFFLIELLQLIHYARFGSIRTGEGPQGLQRKLASHAADDRRENFVDVTADFTGDGRVRPYQSPLRREMDGGEPSRALRDTGEPDEDVSPDSLSDKYSALDFNPIVRQQESSSLERVIIPDVPSSSSPILRLTLDGEEAAQFPLSGPREIRVKTDGYRIDIIVAPDR